MKRNQIDIDQLIQIVRQGGSVRTGIDVYDSNGVLLLEKKVLVNQEKTLLRLKQSGVDNVPLSPTMDGGVWDKSGKRVSLWPGLDRRKKAPDIQLENRIRQIEEIKEEAGRRYGVAKKNIRQVISNIQKSGGQFDHKNVENTVTDLIEFMNTHENAFSFLTHEILSYDDYLYNHSINVCTIATAILTKFNDHFSNFLNEFIYSKTALPFDEKETARSFHYYLPEERYNMAIGYFLHDIGKVLVPFEILNKESRLTDEEFAIVKTHSYVKGIEVMEKNQINNPFITNSVRYHHAALFRGETGCYPDTRVSHEIPIYVKICKLADIYDAMTSKRCYKEALNPVSVVAEIFHKFAGKDPLLQFILHAFVKCIGIHPAGSVVFLMDGRLAYVLDSNGPIIIPFTDRQGATLKSAADPIDMSDKQMQKTWQINKNKAPLSPVDVYGKLPSYLKNG
jgi:HD-GYP domain-containing protein (c-di-GMP phosphodiesterase class II)